MLASTTLSEMTHSNSIQLKLVERHDLYHSQNNIEIAINNIPEIIVASATIFFEYLSAR